MEVLIFLILKDGTLKANSMILEILFQIGA